MMKKEWDSDVKIRFQLVDPPGRADRLSLVAWLAVAALGCTVVGLILVFS
jgi:hypothetical protein